MSSHPLSRESTAHTSSQSPILELSQRYLGTPEQSDCLVLQIEKVGRSISESFPDDQLLTPPNLERESVLGGCFQNQSPSIRDKKEGRQNSLHSLSPKLNLKASQLPSLSGNSIPFIDLSHQFTPSQITPKIPPFQLPKIDTSNLSFSDSSQSSQDSNPLKKVEENRTVVMEARSPSSEKRELLSPPGNLLVANSLNELLYGSQQFGSHISQSSRVSHPVRAHSSLPSNCNQHALSEMCAKTEESSNPFNGAIKIQRKQGSAETTSTSSDTVIALPIPQEEKKSAFSIENGKMPSLPKDQPLVRKRKRQTGSEDLG